MPKTEKNKLLSTRLRLVKLEDTYKKHLFEMLDEWYATGEKIVPYAIRKEDYHD